jgi:hypothetical protein
LRNKNHPPAERGPSERPGRLPAQADATRNGIDQARDSAQQGRFTTAGRTRERHPFPGFQGDGDIPQQGNPVGRNREFFELEQRFHHLLRPYP